MSSLLVSDNLFRVGVGVSVRAFIELQNALDCLSNKRIVSFV